MTPKRIITTWIDNGTYRERDRKLFYKCLESWHRLMPDYDIRIVSTGNILDYGSDPLIEHYLETENGIGASQWARLYWLYKLGGVYVDMDQEAIQRFDELLDGTFFCGHFGPKEPFVGNGMIGAPAGHPFLLEQLEYIKHLDAGHPEFGNESGPRMITRLLQERGWHGQRDFGTITIYPYKWFYPYHWSEQFDPSCIGPETLAIHHWASSWDQNNPATSPWLR